MFRRFLLAAILAVFVPTLSYAKPITMKCALKSDSWIAEEIYFEYDSDRDTARVMDGVIMHFEGAPKTPNISENSAKKLVLTWRVATRVSNQTTKIAYRLAFFKKNQKVLVQAHPHGFINNYTGRGKCTEVSGKIPTS